MLRGDSGRKWIGALALCATVSVACADDWLPISAEELKMTSEPKAPSAPAIYLYRQVDRDDNAPDEIIYARIKILTEEGRKYGDVEIPYNKSTESVRGIQARTIRPDGSVVNFEGTMFEKPLVRGRGIKLLAKTFTLPEVQVGSIIEYRYRHQFQRGYVFDSHWILSDSLFTKQAKFLLLPSRSFMLRFSWPVGLPDGTSPPAIEHGRVKLETHDVPAFVTEDHMPPERELMYRIDFIYNSSDNQEKEPVAYWKKVGKENFHEINRFVDKRRVMEQAVAQIVAAGDGAEVKLRKLYERTQQIRNLSFERRKSDEEKEREDQKDARDVGDVWKRGYGNGTELTWLFLALARAAGFEADPVLVSTRDTYFFNERIMNATQLNSNVVYVKLDGKDLYLDPGTPFTPFGILPWNATAIKGLRIDKDGGKWVSTPLPAATASRTNRKATLRLDLDGSLDGTVTYTYTGLEALWRRIEERNEDEADRKQFLEDQINADIPTGIDVKLKNQPNWNSADANLIVEYELKVPGWATVVGQRALLPIGIFSEREKHTFDHATRVHPLYFTFPFQTEDDITIELPAGAQVTSLPQIHNKDLKVIGYNAAVEDNNGKLHLKREFSANMLLMDRKFYSQVRDFFQMVRADDEQQIVVERNKPPAKR